MELPSRARRLLRELGCASLDLLTEAACPGCGGRTPDLCAPCRAHLVWRPRPACRRCGEPIAAPGEPCRADHRLLQGLAFAVAPLRYLGTGGAIVRRFKFQGDARAGEWLARQLAAAVAGHLDGAFRRALLVPVPTHRRRRRHRGFDHARWLAVEVARRLGLTRLPVLTRTRATLPQGDPRVTNRDRNVSGAFAVRRPAAAVGRAVLLLDDVLTSGSTARACARVLTAGGATTVGLVTACRS